MSDAKSAQALSPSPAEIEQWAYDEDAILWDCQDEDLLLHDVDYIPILTALARDPACPKGEYVLGIIDNYLRHLTIRGPDTELETVKRGIELVDANKITEWTDWLELLKRRLSYRSDPVPTDRAQALKMGRDLFLGRARSGNVNVVGDNEKSWIVDFTVNHGPYRERLHIDKELGVFEWGYR